MVRVTLKIIHTSSCDLTSALLPNYLNLFMMVLLPRFVITSVSSVMPDILDHQTTYAIDGNGKHQPCHNSELSTSCNSIHYHGSIN